MGNEATEIMKERNITVKLSDEDCLSLVEKCGRCGLTVGELLENFIEDLVGSAQSNGYDERVNAGYWFERSSFAAFPEPTLLNHLLTWDYDPEDYLDTMDDLKEAEQEKEYAIAHPEEYDAGAIEFIDDSIVDYRHSLENMRDGWEPHGEPDMEQEIAVIREWVTEKEDFMYQTDEKHVQETSANLGNVTEEELNRVIDSIYDKSEEEMIALARSIKSGENTQPVVQKALESVLRIRIDELQEAYIEYFGKGQINESIHMPKSEGAKLLEEFHQDMLYDGRLTADEVVNKLVSHEVLDPSMLHEPASRELMQTLEEDGYIQSVGTDQYQWNSAAKGLFVMNYNWASSAEIASVYQKYELEGVGENFRDEVQQMLSKGKFDFLQNDIQKFVNVAHNVGNAQMLHDFTHAADVLEDYQSYWKEVNLKQQVNNTISQNDNIKVHMYSGDMEIKTSNFDKIFTVYERNGELGIDWNTQKADPFASLQSFAPNVIFENVATNERFHYSSIENAVERIIDERPDRDVNAARTEEYQKFLQTEEVSSESDMYRLLHNNGYSKLAYPTVTLEGGVFQRAAGASDQQVMEAYGKIKSDMANMVRQSGFKPSNHMLKNVMKINMIAGKNSTMESLAQLYRESRFMKPDNAMKNIADEIGKEFAGQEMAQKTAAALPEAVM